MSLEAPVFGNVGTFFRIDRISTTRIPEGTMNAILSLQRLDAALMADEGEADSTESICCKGSTVSYERCCNTTIME